MSSTREYPNWQIKLARRGNYYHISAGKEVFMSAKKKTKKPVENHKTAAWANIESTNPISKAPHPSLDQTILAKEYADSNEK
jgi:hypothetical protein